MKKLLVIFIGLSILLASCGPQDAIQILKVVTGQISNITSISADCIGNVTGDGGVAIIARGICWSTSQNPTISDSKTINGAGLGTYTCTITGLLPNTTYYIRAYVTNSKGTAYGIQKLLTTSDPGHTTTTLGGIITEDTYLSIDNSPYTITTDVQVAYNCTLTIEPGVIINGNDKYIKIWGVLNAIGSQEEKITFNNVKIAPGNNNNYELFVINIQYSIINEGSVYYPTGHAIYGSINIKDSELSDIPFLYIWYPKANCHIERNIFKRCGGINTGTDHEIKVYIRNNIFFQQQASSYSNTFAISNYASYNSSQTIVEYNSFLSTDKYAIYLRTGYSDANIIATNNYWSTTDVNVINTMIHDKNDDLGCANYIEFRPILTEPHPNTPVFNP